MYIGRSILFAFYKVKGEKISYAQIVNEIDARTGLKKYAFKANCLGVLFMILFVLILTTSLGLNPKIYDPNN